MNHTLIAPLAIRVEIGVGFVAGIVGCASAARVIDVRRSIHLHFGFIRHGAGFHCCSRTLVCDA